MPQHKSAIKRLRQDEKRNQNNRARRSKLKTLTKKVLQSSSKDEATPLLPEAVAFADKMASKNVIHKNNAARIKSKLTLHVNSLS